MLAGPGAADAAVPSGDAAAQTTHHIGETEARAILADAFRKAGFRILYDVALPADGPGSTIAVDGFDPRKKVGYEYIASEELATAESLRKFAPTSVLVVGPATREDVQAAAATFVAALIASQRE